jgi:hypothetical protein
MARESHGSGDPCGLAGRVAVGVGAGCKIPTCQKPPPTGKGWQAGRGFFFRHQAVIHSAATAHRANVSPR